MAGRISIDEAARLTGKSTKTIKKLLVEGKIPGQKIGSTWHADKDFFKDFIEKEEATAAVKVNEATPEVQDEEKATALANAKTARIDAENRRDEAQKLRDKPDELKAREDALVVREKELDEREAKIARAEFDITQRYETVRLVEVDTRGMTQQVAAECDELRAEADAYVEEKEAELWAVEEELRQKRYTLAQLGVKEEIELSAFGVKVLEIRENLKLWMAHTLKHAGRFTKLGEKNGKQYDRFTTIGAALWDAYDSLKEAMAWLEEIEKTADSNPVDTQAEYDRRTSPVIAKIKKILAANRSSL